MSWFGFGKVILLGEHAVVYGYPALAAALDRGVRITPLPTPAGGALRVDIPTWNLRITAGDDHPLARALEAIADAVGVGRPAVTLLGDAQIPCGSGLGSSAAFAVAVARALVDYRERNVPAIRETLGPRPHELNIQTKKPPSTEELIALASAGENVVHGNASGVDVALAAAGGIGVFRRSTGLRPFASAPLRVLVGPSGSPRSTAAMVERVSAAVAGEAADARLHELGALTDAGTVALQAGKLDELGRAMDRAHALLAGLGVSTPLLDGLCEAARDAGAYGAKLTGAGGGGAVIAIAPRECEADVLAAWKKASVTGFVATVGGRA